MVTPPDSADPAETASRPSRPGPARTLGRSLIIVAVLGSTLVWLYALSGAARRDPPNTLDDPAFAAAAEPICARARGAVDALPLAQETPDHRERASVVLEGNGALEDMIADLRPLVPTDGRDAQMLGDWLADWERYLADRASYAERLATDPDARFYVADKGGGIQVTKAIDNLAEVNDMPSCATPEDVA